MSDTEGESSESLKHDRMSVSDHELELSRDEDDMPSAEIDFHEESRPNHELSSSISDSSTSEIQAHRDVPTADCDLGDQTLVGANLSALELDDAAMDLMTGSYSEILTPPHIQEKISESIDTPIQNLAQEGTVSQDGDMVHFVAKNLETKIRLSSPEVPDCIHLQNLPKTTYDDTSNFSQAALLAHLEKEARNIASSVDSLTEHLVVSLHTISAVTVESLTIYKDSVCKTCDAMDANIKSMYQLMAKCEELSKAMAPLYKQAETVKEIKKLLDIMENM